MTSSSAEGPFSKQHGPQALLFIHHGRFFHMQPFLLDHLPLFLDANWGDPIIRYPLSSGSFTPCGGSSDVSFQGKLSNQARIQTFIPSPPLFFTALPPLLPPSKCVAMETATWVCCSCLSCRYKRCTTHLTIGWWIEGWWLTGRVRCLVARRTTFSLCRYSPSLPGIAAVKPPSSAWQRVALMTKPRLAMHNNAQFEVGGGGGGGPI